MMRRSTVCLNVLMFSLLSACAPSGDWRSPAIGETRAAVLGNAIWSKTFGSALPPGPNDVYTQNVAIDGGGNILLIGWFSGAANFGGGCGTLFSPLSSAAAAFVAKFSSSGDCQWVKAYGDPSGLFGTFGYGVAVDAAGYVYVVGGFWGGPGQMGVDFGCGAMFSAGSGDIFLTKLRPDGTCLRSRRFGDSETQLGLAIAIDNNGINTRVLITGQSYGAVDFDGGSLRRPNGTAGSDIYLAKFTSDLDHQNSYDYSISGNEVGTSIAVGPDHTTALTGYFYGEVKFGTDILRSQREALFVAKLRQDMSHQWSHAYGYTDGLPQFGFGVAVDTNQRVLLTGSFFGTLAFGDGDLILYSPGGETVFLASLDSAGTALRAKAFGMRGDMSGRSVVIGPGSSVFLAGRFRGDVDFGTGTLTSNAGQDIFLAKFSDRLVNFDARKYGDQPAASGDSVAVGSDGRVLLGGFFKTSVNFDGQIHPALGDTDAFLTKFEHVCDGANCGGCCEGTVAGICRARDRDHCAAPGLACRACDSALADGCGVDGTCLCGTGLACTAPGRVCSAGICVCQQGRCGTDCHPCTCGDSDQCGTYPTACHVCTCADVNPATPCGTYPSDCHVCGCRDINPAYECGLYPDQCYACTCAQDGPRGAHCGVWGHCQNCCPYPTWECCGDTDYRCCGVGDVCQ